MRNPVFPEDFPRARLAPFTRVRATLRHYAQLTPIGRFGRTVWRHYRPPAAQVIHSAESTQPPIPQYLVIPDLTKHYR